MVLSRWAAQRNGDGSLDAILEINTDISPQRAAQDRLRESEARYARIAANVPGMVYQFVQHPDGSAEFPFISDGAREIYGIEPDSIVNDPSLILDRVHPDDTPSFQASVAQSARALSPWRWEGRIVLPNGQEKWLEGASNPKREPNGDIVWDGLLTDVSARKAAEHELERARSEAERANLAKSEFLSRMSHELRTPLNAILGFGQLLTLSQLSPLDAQSATQIVKAGRHLLELINEVLDIARIESGKLPLSPEAVEIAPLIHEVLDLLRPLAAEGEVALDDLTTCEGFLLADRQRFKQILLNLVSNAIKYNRHGGRVWVSCEEVANRSDLIRVGIHDTGRGFSDAQKARLFTPFDRLGADGSGIEGTGIGLSLCQHLCEAMRATIQLESVEGEGSTFWLCFPRAQNPLLGVEEADGEDGAHAHNTRWVVLYVEDNFSNLQLIQRLLSHRPAVRLLTAMQGGLGLELARQHCPNLILLDLNLPDLSGHEVLRQLRANPQTREIPVVILSADASRGQTERLLELGAQAYLTKPFDIRQFLALMDDLARRFPVSSCTPT